MPTKKKEASNDQTEFEGGDSDDETNNSIREITEIVLRN